MQSRLQGVRGVSLVRTRAPLPCVRLPSGRFYSRLDVARSQTSQRSFPKPPLDPTCGEVVADEITDFPPSFLARNKLRQWLGAANTRQLQVAEVGPPGVFELSFDIQTWNQATSEQISVATGDE